MLPLLFMVLMIALKYGPCVVIVTIHLLGLGMVEHSFVHITPSVPSL